MRGRILGIGWVDGNGPGKGRGDRPCDLSPGELPRIERKDVFNKADRHFGRLDDFSRLGLATIALALQDARLDNWQQKRPWGIIAASRFGCLATDLNYFDTVIPEGGALASPNLFAYTLSNCFTGEAAIRFGLSGPSYVVSEADQHSFTSLHLALESLDSGEAPLVITGICDLPAPVRGSHDEMPGAIFLALAGQPFSSAVGGPVLVCDGGQFHIDSQPVTSWNGLVEAARAKL